MAEITVEEPQRVGASLRYSSVIESNEVGTRRLWFEVPEEFSGWVTDLADPFRGSFTIAPSTSQLEVIREYIRGDCDSDEANRRLV